MTMRTLLATLLAALLLVPGASAAPKSKKAAKPAASSEAAATSATTTTTTAAAAATATTTVEATPAPAPAPAPSVEALPLAEISTTPAAAPAAAPLRPARAFAALGVGGLTPHLFNRLGLAAVPQLSGGWFLPVLDSRIALACSVAYAQPTHERTVSDARVPGGSYRYSIKERDLRLAFGAQYHFMPASGGLSPYAGARVRVHLLDTVINGDAASNAFAEQHEKGTKVGGAPYGGVMWRVGPGALFGEVEVDVAPLDHLVTGETNLNGISVVVGYGLVF